MGSTGWIQCYWCGAWLENGYILEVIGNNVLCEVHWDYFWPDDDVGFRTLCPIEPNAITRATAALSANLRHRVFNDPTISRMIILFLIEDWRR